MSELLRVIAYVFRQQPKDRLGRNEFKQFLSFRLNWYPPGQAAQLLERALGAGLLVAEGEAVRPGFDVGAVDLPVSFRGSARALDEPLSGAPAAPGAPAPPPAPAAPVAPPRDPALDERARALREMAHGRLTPEAAQLLAARERGADVRAAAAQALASLQGVAPADV